LAGLQGVAASAGAACHADTVKISHVLEAMGVPAAFARGTLRFSVGRYTTQVEVEQAATEIIEAVERIRSRQSAQLS
jgi:cysteine desulfurase